MRVMILSCSRHELSLIFVFRERRTRLATQICWIKVARELRKALAEYVCIRDLKLSKMGLMSYVIYRCPC